VLRLASRCAPLVLVALLGAACASPPTLPAPEVEYDGCDAVLVPGPVCVLAASRELRLWVGEAPNARLEVTVDGTEVEAGGELVRGGRRLSLSLPAGAAKVEVRVAGSASWVLAIAEPGSKKPAGSTDVLAEVEAQAIAIDKPNRAGDLAGFRQALARIHLPPQADAESRFLVRFYRGQLAKQEGDYRVAFDEIQAAAEIADRVQSRRYAPSAEQQMALLLRAVGRSSEAARLFEHLRAGPAAANPCKRGQLLNNQAWSELLAREGGEASGDPVPLLEESLKAYATCSSDTGDRQANVLMNLALADLQEGNTARVRDLLAQALQIDPHPSLFHRLWWLDLEGRQALLEGRPTVALRSFAALDDLAAQTGSSDGRLRAYFGEARAHRALGQPAKALATLHAAERLLDEQSMQVPMHEGRETFVAARQSIVGLHLELLLDQGKTAEALERARWARARLLRQLAQSDRLSALPPEQRDRRSRLLNEYQRRRAALEDRAKDDWKLPADQLRHEEAERRAKAEAAKELLDEAFLVLGEPADRGPREQLSVRHGELLLVYHPLGAGWVGFAADEEGVVAHRFELPAELLSRPESLAARLLAPFRSRIERARRIRILPSARLEGVDFHALPFAGDVLAAGRPVVYGLDLAVAPSTARAAGRRALLVADPRGDLPGAAAESVAVRRALQSDRPPWTTEELTVGDASAEAVGRRLAAADLFHYAGHGSFSGLGGWDSSLLLANDTKLTLGDLLALDRLPRWVVLSGCETGRSTAESPVAGLGLAHAFLLAGSQAVVASTRPADDRSLPSFFTKLYREWQRDPDLAAALQRAELAWRREDPGADWASFRLFEP
jgi:tetratricopeptide (TPR) repeat protein